MVVQCYVIFPYDTMNCYITDGNKYAKFNEYVFKTKEDAEDYMNYLSKTDNIIYRIYESNSTNIMLNFSPYKI